MKLTSTSAQPWDKNPKDKKDAPTNLEKEIAFVHGMQVWTVSRVHHTTTS